MNRGLGFELFYAILLASSPLSHSETMARIKSITLVLFFKLSLEGAHALFYFAIAQEEVIWRMGYVLVFMRNQNQNLNG